MQIFATKAIVSKAKEFLVLLIIGILFMGVKGARAIGRHDVSGKRS